MKADYLKTAEVAEELRCSVSKARQLMKNEMTCLAMGTGPYRTRVVERAELERWKQKQLEPPLAQCIAPQKQHKKTRKTMSYLPPDMPLDKRGWPLQPHSPAWQKEMDRRKQAAKGMQTSTL